MPLFEGSTQQTKYRCLVITFVAITIHQPGRKYSNFETLDELARIIEINISLSEMAELAIAHPEAESQEIDFVIGDVVDVTRRMWPGVNKPGGVGRITKIRYNEGIISGIVCLF